MRVSLASNHGCSYSLVWHRRDDRPHSKLALINLRQAPMETPLTVCMYTRLALSLLALLCALGALPSTCSPRRKMKFDSCVAMILVPAGVAGYIVGSIL